MACLLFKAPEWGLEKDSFALLFPLLHKVQGDGKEKVTLQEGGRGGAILRGKFGPVQLCYYDHDHRYYHRCDYC